MKDAMYLDHLIHEHHALDAQIHELTRGAKVLTAEEEIELARLKKLKLHKKDQITQMQGQMHGAIAEATHRAPTEHHAAH